MKKTIMPKYEKPTSRRFITTNRPLCCMESNARGHIKACQDVYCSCICPNPICTGYCSCPCTCPNTAMKQVENDFLSDISLQKVYKINDNCLLRREAFGNLLCNTDTLCISVINDSAANILNLLNENNTPCQIASALREKYAQSEDFLLRDIRNFLITMLSMGILEPISERN